MAGKPDCLGRGQRELTGKVGQRLQRGAHTLIDLGAGLRGHLRALLDHRERGFGLQVARPQPRGSIVQLRAQLEQRISHGHKVIEGSIAGDTRAPGLTKS